MAGHVLKVRTTKVFLGDGGCNGFHTCIGSLEYAVCPGIAVVAQYLVAA
jgi:hypothetical protein